MAVSVPLPSELFRARPIVPAELRTREWSGIGMPWAADASGRRTVTWVKERAFYMAGETNIDRLVEYRARIADVLSGRYSEAQARTELRRYLNETGYQAPEGLRGTIKDLYTSNRLNATIRTNADMVRGYIQQKRLVGKADYPAMELARKRHSQEERPWASIWAGTGGKIYQERMIALVGDPVWLGISDFGNEYPPYKWGSGMWAYPVSREDCIKLGVIAPDEYPDTGRTESLNQSLEKTYPGEVDKRLLDEISEAMKGFTEVKPVPGGHALVFTDPNGCRPQNWRDIGKVITDELPEGYEHYQADAFRDWVADSNRYMTGEAGLDEKEDLIRLFTRIIPVGDNGGKDKVYRALTFNDAAQQQDFLKAIKAEGYGARPGYIAESWTGNRQAAEKYASQGMHQVVLQSNSYQSRKRLDSMYKTVTPEKQTPHDPVSREGESVFLNGTRFSVRQTESRKNRKGGVTYYVDVKEM